MYTVFTHSWRGNSFKLLKIYKSDDLGPDAHADEPAYPENAAADALETD
jgi:hypothetical protein